MFQAQRIVNGKCRPVISHGYGGAKKEMPTSLAAPAKFGSVPTAAAMVGSASSPPLWTGQDWRPILGTSVEGSLKVLHSNIGNNGGIILSKFAEVQPPRCNASMSPQSVPMGEQVCAL